VARLETLATRRSQLWLLQLRRSQLWLLQLRRSQEAQLHGTKTIGDRRLEHRLWDWPQFRISAVHTHMHKTHTG